MKRRCSLCVSLAVMLCLCGCASFSSVLHGSIEAALGMDTREEAADTEENAESGDLAQQERESVPAATDAAAPNQDSSEPEPSQAPLVPPQEAEPIWNAQAQAVETPETEKPDAPRTPETEETQAVETLETEKPDDADAPGLSEAAPLPLAGRILCIDPGHCVTPLTGKGHTGPVSPLSDERKPLYTAGTEGAHMTEERLNLIVGLKLRDALEALGAEVVMTREVSEITITGIERCEIANRAGADANIHIHADGADSPSAHGVSVLVPAEGLLGTPSILEESVRLGKLMVDAVAERTGAKNRGISPRSDMSGFNFSEVPSVLIEMGFMTNPQEDALLESDEYQNKIVEGMVDSLFAWYGIARES